MRIIIILLFPLLSASQSTVDSMGNIVQYVKQVDSVKYFASKFRADSIINGLVSFINTQAGAKLNISDSANMLTNYTRKAVPIGYTSGMGGAVVQATSKTTGVTLNKIAGRITMNGAALAAAAEVSFVLTNSFIAATDLVIINIQSIGTAGSYFVTVGAVSAGSCAITIGNTSAASLSQALVLNFAIIKSAIN